MKPILQSNFEYFQKTYPDAAAFLVGAAVRYEHASIVNQKHNGASRLGWQINRLQELDDSLRWRLEIAY